MARAMLAAPQQSRQSVIHSTLEVRAALGAALAAHTISEYKEA